MIKDSATIKDEGLAVLKHEEEDTNDHGESDKIIKTVKLSSRRSYPTRTRSKRRGATGEQ
jgi:hypothetical protein